MDFLAKFPDESVDLCITDVPYESLEKHRKKGTKTRLKESKGSSNKWFGIFPNDRLPAFFEEVYRVMKNNTHFYFFCDQETMFLAKPMAEEAGFRFWKPIVWDKVAIGMGYHYRARYELILFFEKGKRKLKNLSVPDILTHKRIKGGYPTEKPVGLMEELVLQSSSPGELVIDPFAGVAPVVLAAIQQGRRFYYNDISGEAKEEAYRRAEEQLMGLAHAMDVIAQQSLAKHDYQSIGKNV